MAVAVAHGEPQQERGVPEQPPQALRATQVVVVGELVEKPVEPLAGLAAHPALQALHQAVEVEVHPVGQVALVPMVR